MEKNGRPVLTRAKLSFNPHRGATENASTENESTGGWNMQVRNT